MKQLTIIYKSGVVVELVCADAHIRRSYNRGDELALSDPKPKPMILGLEHIAAIWEGPISGAHAPVRHRGVELPMDE